jgi:N-acetylmuramoyl-L-alanine amidase
MFRKSIILIIISLALVSIQAADLSIVFKPENQSAKLTTKMLDGRDYVDLRQLESVIFAKTKLELADQRIYLTLYGEQFLFLINAEFYSFKNEIFNMHYPVLQDAGKYYLPLNFMTELLPLHFPRDVVFKDSKLQMTKPKDKGIQVIVLDPGHGGKDPGAVGKNKSHESDVNLAVSLKLKQLLEKELGVKVLLTRDSNYFVTLGFRTDFANNNKADLFIALHSNASRNRSAHGIETYYLSTAKTSDARAVEALENGVVELYEGVEAKKQFDNLDFILSDLSQTEHLENSNNLAMIVQRNLVAGVKGSDLGVKQASFYVLRGAFMPSILIEMGFISNANEEALLTNSVYQDRLARTIFEGIKRYKFRYDRTRNT